MIRNPLNLPLELSRAPMLKVFLALPCFALHRAILATAPSGTAESALVNYYFQKAGMTHHLYYEEFDRREFDLPLSFVTYQDIKGELFKLAFDPDGSVYLSEFFRVCTPRCFATAFLDLLPYIPRLCFHLHAHIIVISLFRHGCMAMRYMMLKIMWQFLPTLYCHEKGHRVIMSALKTCPLPVRQAISRGLHRPFYTQ